MGSSAPGVSARPAARADYDHLAVVFDQAEQLHHQGLPAVFRKPPDRFPSRDLFEQLVTSEGSAVFVAETGADLAGFVTLHVESAPEEQILVRRTYRIPPITRAN